MAVTGRKLANDLPMKHYVGTKRKLYGGVSSLRISCKSATGAFLELPEPIASHNTSAKQRRQYAQVCDR